MYNLLRRTVFVGLLPVGIPAGIHYKLSQIPSIVFDLDSTLIHAVRVHNGVNYKYLPSTRHEISVDNEKFRVFTRPFAGMTLWLLSRYTKLHLFTTADRTYTDETLFALNWGKYFHSTTTRDEIDDDAKDLTKITSAPAILVDDRSDNHVSGQEFYHIPQYKVYNKRDRGLIALLCYMIRK